MFITMEENGIYWLSDEAYWYIYTVKTEKWGSPYQVL